MWDVTTALQQAFAGNLSELDHILGLCDFTVEEAAKYCSVSPNTVRRWRRTGKPNPTALRLLAIHAGYVPWDGWQGWEIHGECLFPPGYSRNGIRPGHFWSYPYTFQLCSELQRITDDQRARIEELEAQLQTFTDRPKAKLYAFPAR